MYQKKAKRLLSKKGFSLEYGVRFLRREIQNSIENPLSELLLAGVGQHEFTKNYIIPNNQKIYFIKKNITPN